MNYVWGWIKHIKLKFSDWVAPASLLDVSDEVTLLQKHFLDNKSWLDALSSGWRARSLLSKTAYIAGVVVMAGTIGWWVGAVFQWMLLVSLTVFITHTLLIAHENKRYENAAMFAAESQVLSLSIKKNSEFFEAARDKLDATQSELAGQIVKMQAQSAALDAEGQQIKQHNKALLPVIEDLTAETMVFIQKAGVASTRLALISDQLRNHDEGIQRSIDKARNLDKTLDSFASATQALKTSQQTFSLAANHFCMFNLKPVPKKELPEMRHERQLMEDSALILDLIGLYPSLLV